MAHQVIKYRLNADGTVPEFLCLHQEGVGGVFAVVDPNTPGPRDLIMIGLSENGYETGDFEVIATKADLQAYLTAEGTNWTQPDPANSLDDTLKVPFDPAAAADWVWSRMEALNASGQ